jgi:hypothetical protein
MGSASALSVGRSIISGTVEVLEHETVVKVDEGLNPVRK